MAPNYQSISTARVQTDQANGNVTSLATLPVTLPPAGSGPSLAPAPPYTEHDLEVVSHGSVTPPPSYAESNPGLIIGDAKTPPCAYKSLLLSLRYGPNPEKPDDGGAICIKASKKSSSLQKLCNPYDNNDSAAGPKTTSRVQALKPSCCATTSLLGSKELNYHVNPNNDVYRWQMTDTPIPVSIDMSSFETNEQGLMARRCLVIVLNKFNANNVGPKFHFVNDPSCSAFFVRFGGDHSIYAHAFFPGSLPKDWYIDVFKPGLTLSAEQQEFLIRTGGGDTAKLQALEQNLVKILTHEMLHVVGVRHCDAQLTEKETCVRFPPDLSDDENNKELLMQRFVNWKSLSQLEWMSRTIQEIQQIYAMKVGECIGCHRIRDVSWESGAKQRKEMALRNARCCGAWP